MYNIQQFVSSTDRFGLFGSQEFRVNELSKKLRLPVEAIIKAVQEVGFDEEEVEEYIRDRENRSLF